jgi:hypothetical protein
MRAHFRRLQGGVAAPWSRTLWPWSPVSQWVQRRAARTPGERRSVQGQPPPSRIQQAVADGPALYELRWWRKSANEDRGRGHAHYRSRHSGRSRRGNRCLVGLGLCPEAGRAPGFSRRSGLHRSARHHLGPRPAGCVRPRKESLAAGTSPALSSARCDGGRDLDGPATRSHRHQRSPDVRSAWEPGTSEWKNLDPPQDAGSSVVADTHDLLLYGGDGSPAELDLDTGKWRSLPALQPRRLRFAQVVVLAGADVVELSDTTATATDPATGASRWTSTAPFVANPESMSAGDGDLFAWASEPMGPTGQAPRLEALNLATGAWTVMPNSPLPAELGGSLLWTGNRLLVTVSGMSGDPWDSNGPAAAAEWDPRTSSWYKEPEPLASGGWQEAVELLRGSPLMASVPSTAVLPLAASDTLPYHPRSETIPTCLAGQLTATAHYAGGSVGVGGSTEEYISVTNVGPSPCTLSQVPGIELVTEQGQPLPVKVRVDPNAEVGIASGRRVPQGIVTLQPGVTGSAYLESPFSDVAVRDVCRSSVQVATGAILSFPSGTVPAVPERTTGDDQYFASLLDCNGTFDVSPWRASVWDA